MDKRRGRDVKICDNCGHFSNLNISVQLQDWCAECLFLWKPEKYSNWTPKNCLGVRHEQKNCLGLRKEIKA